MRAAAESETADRPALAATLILLGVGILSLQDSLVKLISDQVSLWQFQTLRAGGNLLLLFAIGRILYGGSPWRPRRIWAVALRSGCLTVTMVLFFGGAPFLSVAEMGAGLYTYPLFIAIAAALLLGEHVGPRRIIAILIGFAGALLILKPGAESFRAAALLPLGAGVTYAATIMVTRRYCREESPVTLAVGVAIGFFTVGLLGVLVFSLWTPAALSESWPYLFTGWRTAEDGAFGLALPTLSVLAIVFFCSALNLSANLSLTRAYQTGESSWLAPFDYSYLAFAALWTLILFGETPDALTLLGMGLIGGAGLFIAWRERARPPRAPAARSEEGPPRSDL